MVNFSRVFLSDWGSISSTRSIFWLYFFAKTTHTLSRCLVIRCTYSIKMSSPVIIIFYFFFSGVSPSFESSASCGCLSCYSEEGFPVCDRSSIVFSAPSVFNWWLPCSKSLIIVVWLFWIIAMGVSEAGVLILSLNGVIFTESVSTDSDGFKSFFFSFASCTTVFAFLGSSTANFSS